MTNTVRSIGLGTRWFVRSGRNSRALTVRRILGYTCMLTVVFLSITLWSANADRDARGQAQEPKYSFNGDPQFRYSVRNAPFREDIWTTIALSGPADSPAPPGLPRFPGPNEAWVSPAVAAAIAQNPQVANRVPGRVVGTISSEGLESPDQYFVQVGTSKNPNASPGAGWGAKQPFSDRPRLPRLGLFAILLTMVGLPSMMLAMVATRLSSQSRRRDLAALHLIGLPRRDLAIASATETVWCLLSAGAVSLVISAVMAALAAPRGWFGFTWFNLPTVIPLLEVAAAWSLITAAAAVVTFRVTRSSLTEVFEAREGGPATRSVLALLPLVTGIALLAGVVLPAMVLGRAMSSELSFYGFVLGTLLAGIGALLALGPLLRAIATFWHKRSRTLLSTLSSRRLWWSSDSLARSTAALLVLVISAIIGSAVVADLDNLSTQSPQGNLYSVSFGKTDTEQALAMVAVPAPARLLITGDADNPLTVGTCQDLRTFLSRTDSIDLSPWEQCQEGQRYRLSEGLGDLPFPEGTFLAQDLADFRGSTENADLIVSPGPKEHAIDDYVNRLTVGGMQPDQVSTVGIDSLHPIVAIVRGLLLTMFLAGVLIAVVTALLTVGDDLRASAAQRARLRVIGLSTRQSSGPHILALTAATGVCLVLAKIVGWLAGLGYDVAGGTGATPGLTGATVSAVSVLGAIGLVLAATRLALRDNLDLADLLHDE